MTKEIDATKQAEHAYAAHPGTRVLEWFWRGAALAESRRALPEPNARSTELGLRARNSAEIARRVLMPAEPIDDAAIRAAASELYRVSAYWALCAMSTGSVSTAGTAYDASVWEGLDEGLLAEAAHGAERVEALRTLLREGSFVYFAELPEAARVLACSELQGLARVLSAKLDEPTRALRVNYLQRCLRIGVLALAALIGVMCALRWRDADDLAAGKPWTASSENSPACVSPAQHCAESPNFFFHTKEEANPWVEFDLGMTRSISRMQVENRRDCCSDRTSPLTVEVSTDHEHWKPVAREAEDFTTWNSSFAAVDARWVRLRSYRKTFLHLAEVRIWP